MKKMITLSLLFLGSLNLASQEPPFTTASVEKLTLDQIGELIKKYNINHHRIYSFAKISFPKYTKKL